MHQLISNALETSGLLDQLPSIIQNRKKYFQSRWDLPGRRYKKIEWLVYNYTPYTQYSNYNQLIHPIHISIHVSPVTRFFNVFHVCFPLLFCWPLSRAPCRPRWMRALSTPWAWKVASPTSSTPRPEVM